MKLKEKFKEKKWYVLILNEEGTFLTTLRIPTFDRIRLEDKHGIIYEENGKGFVGYRLFLSKEEELIFKTTYKNYIVKFEPLNMDGKTEIETIVWK